MGPKLFSFYTGGLSEQINGPNSDIVIYADDSFVVCHASTEEDLVEVVRTTLMRHMPWLTDHGMIVNVCKTDLVKFGKNPRLEVDVGEH